jgi:hypothetical protein
MGIVHDAMNLLHENPGKTFCVDCWAKLAGQTAPADLVVLSILTRSLVESAGCTVEAGRCSVCHQRARVVRKLPSSEVRLMGHSR